MTKLTATRPECVGEVPGSASKILLATFGSLGDLHPYIALGLGLKERGHHVVLATTGIYREKVQGEGLEFQPICPDMPPLQESQALVSRIMDPVKGTEVIMKEVLGPHLRAQYDDIATAARGADLLVSHVLTFGVRMVAELSRRPWVGTMLQPMMFTSAHEPPIPPHAPQLAFLYGFGVSINRRLVALGKRTLRPLTVPVNQLRVELGLPPLAHPMLDGQQSPYLNLAMFSAQLGDRQPDWPEHTILTGFPFYDRLSAGTSISPELVRFLDNGPAPLVFTLGSSAVMLGTDFYTESIKAAVNLGQRAVLLVGTEDWNRLPAKLPNGVIAVGYAPHGDLFPRAAAIIHQGGVGTTGQAMRSGVPMLVVPFAHDQPDNGFRIQRRGIGRMILRKHYNAETATRELRRILEQPQYRQTAAAVGLRVRAESGVASACDAIEQLLREVALRR